MELTQLRLRPRISISEPSSPGLEFPTMQVAFRLTLEGYQLEPMVASTLFLDGVRSHISYR